MSDSRFVHDAKETIDCPEFPSIIDEMKPLFYFDQRKIRPAQSKQGFETPFFQDAPQKIIFNPYFRKHIENEDEEEKTFDSAGFNEIDIPKNSYQDQAYVSSGSENVDIIASSDPKPRFFSRCDSFGGEVGAVSKVQRE